MDAAALDPQLVADMAASVQAAIIDCLAGKALLALERTGFKRLCVGGGVAANRPFRERLEALAAERGFELHMPPLSLCTDNAVMGAIAVERLKAGQFAALDLDIEAGLDRVAAPDQPRLKPRLALRSARPAGRGLSACYSAGAQVRVRRAVDHFAVGVEPRAVAGAVPRASRPWFQCTMQPRCGQTADSSVSLPVLVAVDGDLRAGRGARRRRSPGAISSTESTSPRREPVGVLGGDVEVLLARTSPAARSVLRDGS